MYGWLVNIATARLLILANVFLGHLLSSSRILLRTLLCTVRNCEYFFCIGTDALHDDLHHSRQIAVILNAFARAGTIPAIGSVTPELSRCVQDYQPFSVTRVDTASEAEIATG